MAGKGVEDMGQVVEMEGEEEGWLKRGQAVDRGDENIGQLNMERGRMNMGDVVDRVDEGKVQFDKGQVVGDKGGEDMRQFYGGKVVVDMGV